MKKKKSFRVIGFFNEAGKKTHSKLLNSFELLFSLNFWREKIQLKHPIIESDVSGEQTKKSNYSTNGLIISRSFRRLHNLQMHSIKKNAKPAATPSSNTKKQLK